MVIDGLYRCPQCGEDLPANNFDSFIISHFDDEDYPVCDECREWNDEDHYDGEDDDYGDDD